MIVRRLLPLVVVLLSAVCQSEAAVLCAAKNGTVKLRESTCKGKKEKAIDPVALGLQGPPGPPGAKGADGSPGTTTIAAYVEVPENNLGNRDVLDVPGFGKVIVQNGGCATLVSIETVAPAYVNTTATDQDVFAFSFAQSIGPAAGYAVAMPGAETSFTLLHGRNDYLTLHVRQRTGTAQATIQIFFDAEGGPGSVCKVSAQAVTTSS